MEPVANGLHGAELRSNVRFAYSELMCNCPNSFLHCPGRDCGGPGGGFRTGKCSGSSLLLPVQNSQGHHNYHQDHRSSSISMVLDMSLFEAQEDLINAEAHEVFESKLQYQHLYAATVLLRPRNLYRQRT